MTYDKLVKFLSTYKKCSYVKILYKIDVGTNKAKVNHCSVNKLVRMTVRIGLNYKPTTSDAWFSPTNISGIVKNNYDESRLYLQAFLSPNKPKVKYLFNGRIERKSFLVDYGYLNTKQFLHSSGNMFTLNIDNIIKIGKEVK